MVDPESKFQACGMNFEGKSRACWDCREPRMELNWIVAGKRVQRDQE